MNINNHETCPIRLECVPCDFCHGNTFSSFCTGVDREFKLAMKFSVVRCQSCGLLQLNPRPIAEDIPLIYPANYGFYQPIQESLLLRMRTIVARIRGRIKRYTVLDDLPPGRIFDVGCATGTSNYPYRKSGSLLDLKNRGWSVAGCDIDANAVGVANKLGLNVLPGMITDISWPMSDLDVVRFNHVLEHSVSPRNDIKKAYDLLKPSGRLVICVPNIASGCYSLFGSRWSGLDLPRHFYHFTPESLADYCKQAGLEVEREYHCSFAEDLMHSLVHVINARESDEDRLYCSSSNRLEEALSPRQVKQLTLSLRPLVDYFDRMRWGDNYTVVARKRAV